MSEPLTIWHALDHPDHPLAGSERMSILHGAQLASSRVQRMSDPRFLDITRRALECADIDPNKQSSAWWIGTVIGTRAGMLKLDVNEPESPGFQVSGLHDARGAGIYIGREVAHLSFPGKLLTAIPRMLPHTPENVIGLAIGIRHAELSS